jgi:hypothetical protein
MSTVMQHFDKSTPTVRAAYDAILDAARKLGPLEEEPKKTSIHLCNGTAFAGVATRKESLILTLKSAERINSSRVQKSRTDLNESLARGDSDQGALRRGSRTARLARGRIPIDDAASLDGPRRR